MKKAIRFMVVALAGGLAGFFAVRAGNPPAREASPASGDRAKPSDSARQPQSASDPEAGPAKHDLAALLKWNRKDKAAGTPGAREMERLDKGELRSLLIDLTSEGQADPLGAGSTARIAATELFKREGAAAFDWVAGLDPSLRKAVYPRILQAALEADAIAYKAKFDEYVKENGEGAARSFIYPMIGGAIERGAEDVIKLREAYGDALKQFMLPVGTLPDDFDFHRFFTGMPDPSTREGMGKAFQYWSAKDKEAAWTGFKEMAAGEKPGAAGYLPCLFDGVAAVAGASKAADWLAPKLAELSDAQRTQALSYFGLTGPLEAETVSALIPLLGSDADRMKLAQRAVASSGGASSAGAAALTALPSDKLRTEVLLNHVRTFGFDEMPATSRDRLRGVVEAMMDQVKLPGAMRDQVTAEFEARSGGGR